MFTITIDEVVNGFVVRAYDPKDGYLINEFHEERIDALRAVNKLFEDQILSELERRYNYASTM